MPFWCYMHIMLFGKKGAIWPTRGFPIKYGDQILKTLGGSPSAYWGFSVPLKGHQKGSTEVARGNQAVDQAAKRAALQNNDLIWVATLVPQTKLPETPSYTEGETLKAKSEGFQEGHMGWFQKERLYFCLEISNGSWLTLTCHHSFKGKGPPNLTRKVPQRNRLPNNYKASGLLSYLSVK